MNKKIITSVAILAMGITAQAQVVWDMPSNYAGMNFVPAIFTSNNKATLQLFDDGAGSGKAHFYIYDENCQLSKHFPKATQTQKVETYTEEAFVTPTAAKYQHPPYFSPVYDSNGQKMTAASQAEMIEKLQNKDRYSCNAFTDLDGNPGCYYTNHPYYKDFYLEDVFGQAYPKNFYRINEDGYVYNASSVSYAPVFDELSAEWQKVEGSSEWHELSLGRPFHPDYIDADQLLNVNGIVCTQTLFNDDDKWEYCVPHIGSVSTVYNNNETYSMTSDNKVKISRRVNNVPYYDGVAIYNEDGQLVQTINLGSETTEVNCNEIFFEKMFKLNGKLYLDFSYRLGVGDYYKVLYLYDKSTTSVKEVARAKSVAPFITANGNAINVNIMESDGDSNAVLVNTSGQTMATSHIASGSTSTTINTASVPKGIYNVAVVKGGNVTRPQKIVLK